MTDRLQLSVPRGEARRLLHRQINRGAEVINLPLDDEQLYRRASIEEEKWKHNTILLLRQIYSNASIADHYAPPNEATMSADWDIEVQYFRGDLERRIGKLEGYLQALDDLTEVLQDHLEGEKPTDTVLRIMRHFHTVARQLQRRKRQRSPFLINDEYDVQDLLAALLKSVFDDVRGEEEMPSYGATRSIIDFLLPREGIAVETKMTRESMTMRDLREQLSADIDSYRKHPDASSLICFVYDPQGYLENPVALEWDLSGARNEMMVHVVVNPGGQNQ